MNKFNLDKTDRAILQALQEDSSLSNIDLAKKICLSPSPCSRRLRILEEQGFFRGRVTLLNPDKIGLPVNVFVQVTMHQQAKKHLQKFEETVTQWPEVMECYLMTGNFDYFIRLAVSDLHAYQEFLDTRLTQVDGIDNIQSSFSLKQIQYKTAFPLEHL